MNQFPSAVGKLFPHKDGRSNHRRQKSIKGENSECVNVILMRRGQRNGDVEKSKTRILVKEKQNRMSERS